MRRKGSSSKSSSRKKSSSKGSSTGWPQTSRKCSQLLSPAVGSRAVRVAVVRLSRFEHAPSDEVFELKLHPSVDRRRAAGRWARTDHDERLVEAVVDRAL